MNIRTQDITGLVLAGGQGQRMGGLDKGLQKYGTEALVAHVVRRLKPQIGALMISANRHLTDYRAHADDVISDAYAGYAGPLAGMHAGLRHCGTRWLLTAPCDSPFLPDDLASRLSAALITHDAQLAYAVTGPHTSPQLHPVFALMSIDVRDSLDAYLAAGGRKVREWQASVRAVAVSFPDEQAFRNLNTLAELQAASQDFMR